MASISGFSNLNNYSFLFSNTSSNKTNSLDLFSNSGSNPLGDYALIKSGVYKKLLNAYYQKNGTTDKTTSKTDGEEDSTQTLTTVKSAAEDLKDSVEELGKSSLYKKTGVDNDGNYTYDRDAITKAVKKYVTDYNSYMESAGDAESLGVLSKTLNIQKATATNKGLLKSIGITIGKDNKLVVDEEKLNNASISDLTSLFKGSGSYGDSVSKKANEVYKLANNTAMSNTHASSYTFNGTYSTMGTSSGSINKYL